MEVTFVNPRPPNLEIISWFLNHIPWHISTRVICKTNIIKRPRLSVCLSMLRTCATYNSWVKASVNHRANGCSCFPRIVPKFVSAILCRRKNRSQLGRETGPAYVKVCLHETQFFVVRLKICVVPNKLKRFSLSFTTQIRSYDTRSVFFE
jgi:hypothetical protein